MKQEPKLQLKKIESPKIAEKIVEKIAEKIAEKTDETKDPEYFDPKTLRFDFDLSKTNYQLDRLQNRFLEFYLRSDQRFRRAFHQDFTKDFVGFIMDKTKLREPIHISMMGSVRCHSKGTTILMSNGEWKNIEEIKIGDKVLSPQKDGKNIFSKVIGTSQFLSEDNYDVYDKNNKNILFNCSGEHKIPTYFRGTLRIDKKNSKSKRKANWYFIEKKANEFYKMSHRNNYLISSFPIEKFEYQNNCKINPYVLGVYLGDGHFSNQLSISNSKKEIIKIIKKYYIISNTIKRESKTLSYNICSCFSVNGKLGNLLKRYGLRYKKSGEKFIPKEALLSNINYRRKLLAGLIDTDGYFSKNTSYSITTKSKQLAKDIIFLVNSLGGTGHIIPIEKSIKSYKFKGKYFKISFYLGKEIEKIPLIVKYKIREKIKDYWKLTPNRISFSMKKIKPQIVYGIQLDSQSKWYILDNMIISHNSGKSYTAISLCAIHQACYKRKFNINYICANSGEYLEKLKTFPPEKLFDRIFLLDESKESVFNIGSLARKSKLQDVANIIAKNNISTCQLNPVKFVNSDASYGIRIFGRCWNTRTTRSMLYNLQESAKLIPVGNLYIPIFTTLLPKDYAEPLEKAYLEKKDRWIDGERNGTGGDVLAQIRRKSAEHFIKDKQFLTLKTHDQKITYISQTLGSEFTKGEVEDIFQITKLLERGIVFDKK